MTSFAYQALTPTGHVVAGTLEGPTRAAISIELERQSLLPIEIAEGVPRPQSVSSGITALFAQRPGAGDVIRVTEDLSALLTAGVALDRAILIISQTATKPVIAALLRC